MRNLKGRRTLVRYLLRDPAQPMIDPLASLSGSQWNIEVLNLCAMASAAGPLILRIFQVDRPEAAVRTGPTLRSGLTMERSWSSLRASASAQQEADQPVEVDQFQQGSQLD